MTKTDYLFFGGAIILSILSIVFLIIVKKKTR